jgi:hypothetical protein
MTKAVSRDGALRWLLHDGVRWALSTTRGTSPRPPWCRFSVARKKRVLTSSAKVKRFEGQGSTEACQLAVLEVCGDRPLTIGDSIYHVPFISLTNTGHKLVRLVGLGCSVVLLNRGRGATTARLHRRNVGDMIGHEGSISTEARNHLYLIGLNRPNKYNGYTPTMARQLVEAMGSVRNFVCEQV